MRQYAGFKAERQISRDPLPAGGYVAKILDAKEITYDWGNVLAISFDISEGEYKDFFAADYRANTNEDKKWRGVYRLIEPKDDGSEKDGWTKNTFNGAIWAVEQSNPGYHWDWKEETLKGKNIGVIFRNKEWEYDGKTGWTTEAGMFDTVERIHDGSFKPLKDKPLKNKSASSGNAFSSAGAFGAAVDADGSDLPF